MKTIKSLLITALLILGVVLYAQGSELEYITANHLEKTTKFETLLNGISNLTERFARNDTDEPVVSMSYTLDHPELVYEVDYHMESWMTAPFESSMAEAELELEDWMSAPFECSVNEAELAVETWMTLPFEAAETIELEDWMTNPWI